MLKRSQLAELSPRPGASPGLLRRRYSVPETIMRKYRLAQQRSECEESGSAASASPVQCESPIAGRSGRRDRELMRRSALLRRLWGRPSGPAAVCRCGEPCGGRATRSLDGSCSELRPSRSVAPAAWATPKRQRLDSPAPHEDMLRLAMRNSYDRAEESHESKSRSDLSDSCRLLTHAITSYVESSSDHHYTDRSDDGCEKNVFAKYCEQSHLISAPFKVESEKIRELETSTEAEVEKRELTDEHTDSSEAFPTSNCTTTEMNAFSDSKVCTQISKSSHIDGRVSERSVSIDNYEDNILPYDGPVVIETPSYEVLEIVVSETISTDSAPNIGERSFEAVSQSPSNALNLKASVINNKKMHSINIDDYVSNILVESLNSLTDQLESMNASIGGDKRISIVEKEIKVKLQNTGVNTIVHLSPTSNNQIIFGNEELCLREDQMDSCNNPREITESVTIRDEMHSIESNNNLTSADSSRDRGPGHDQYCRDNILPHDNVNQAVLQQIQKLFQDELKNVDPETNYPSNAMPGISHIEISNVDVYINNNTESYQPSTETIEVLTQRSSKDSEAIGGVGTSNYYPNTTEGGALVPRFSALPHSESMEVNTSSSDDAELVSSDCTSLVDSLEDPNSPRSLVLRRAFYNNKRSELVRSAIDVLDLLPDSALKSDNGYPKEKGESFFVRIKDNDCDCEKENIVVADHMPDKIKQRLYRRHRKRELRMECARRSKVKQLRRELERQRNKELHKSKREMEKECMAIVNSLIDDVISKIAQDEYKCMRIKQKSNKITSVKFDDNLHKKSCKKNTEVFHTIESMNSSNGFASEDVDREHKKREKRQVYGKLSLQTHPSLRLDERGPKRIYQKSEIHDGNNRIEILEILEYADSSQSSPEINNSDENRNNNTKNKKSRIPILVHERISKSSKDLKGNIKVTPPSSPVSAQPVFQRDKNDKTSRLAKLLETLDDEGSCLGPITSPPARRASVPQQDTRPARRFRRVFDIIPEERSSLSVDSSNEDVTRERRASAPGIITPRPSDQIEPAAHEVESKNLPKRLCHPDSQTKTRETRSAATSPVIEERRQSVSKTTMTSPSRRSAGADSRSRWLGLARDHEGTTGSKEKSVETDELVQRKSVTTQYDLNSNCRRTVRTMETEKTEPIIVGSDRGRSEKEKTKKRKEESEQNCRRRADRAKSESRRNNCMDEKADYIIRKTDKRKIQMISVEKSEEETFRRSGRRADCLRSASDGERGGGRRGRGGSSSDSDSGGLLCALAPRFTRTRRRRRSPPPLPPAPPPLEPASSQDGWSVTVAGSCHAPLPADVEMRVRFPAATSTGSARAGIPQQAISPRRCPHCSRARLHPAPSPSPPLPAPRPIKPDMRILTVSKKEAIADSSILASKSTKKSIETLPELDAYRTTRNKTKSSIKTRRGCSLHCWLPADEPCEQRLSRESDGLSVLGCAIIPELKPRVPTMSERDLTRFHTPRLYLRS